MFCPRCREEYREGFDWCRDCDMALVESLPSAPNETGSRGRGTRERGGLPEQALDPDTPLRRVDVPPDQRLVTVGRYLSPIEAHGCRMALEQAGLRAWVLEESTSASFGVGVGARLQVAAQDEPAARAILAAEQVDSAEVLPESAWELEEAMAAIAGRPRGEEIPDQEPPASEKDSGPRPFARLELVAVLLVACVYPILSGRLGGPDETPIRPAEFVIGAFFYAGLALVVWMLLQNGRGPLSPMPLPKLATEWAREIVIGMVLFVGLLTVHVRILPWLRFAGVPDAPSRWDAFFRLPGVVWLYPLPCLLGALYEELVFRAYLISRLPLVLGRTRLLSALAAAALFAATHSYAPRSTMVVFLDGLAYGLVYLGGRSLPRLVVAHWMYDLAVMWRHLGGR